MKKALKLIVFLLGLCGMFSLLSAQPTPVTTQSLNKMPLAFTKNMGQWDEQVQFRTSSGGATIWICRDKVVYQFLREIERAGDTRHSGESRNPASPDFDLMDKFNHEPDSMEQLVITARFVNPNPDVRIVGEEMMEYKCNYFIGNDPNKWHTDVPSYEAVTLHGVYDGVDLNLFSGESGMLIFQYEITPNTSSEIIRIEYDGVESVLRDSSGKITTQTEWGEISGILASPTDTIELISPVFFGFEGDQSNWFSEENSSVLRSTQAGGLVYSTYLGGAYYDWGQAVAIDGTGSAFVAGTTESINFPTQNAYDSNLGSFGQDAFVTKFSVAGNSLMYSTYIGGSNSTMGLGIAVDGTGNAYVTGQTRSSDYPTQNAYDASFSGLSDAFVSKLSASGSTLVYSTYLGGSGQEAGIDIAVGGSNDAFVTGLTSSVNFPSQNAYDDSFSGGEYDAFVTKFSPTGNSIVYSTYIGGSGDDVSSGITVNGSEDAYITGGTESSNFPTQNAYDLTHNGGSDVFVAKFFSSGNTLAYSTYLGGSGYDYNGNASIAVDGSGSAYVIGQTFSADFPTQNAYDVSLSGLSDAFVSKLSSNGTSLTYSTYLGGSQQENGIGIAIDGSSNVYVTGYTVSPDFPTFLAYDISFGGGIDSADAFVTRISASGNSLAYSTYLGGSGHENGVAIAVDASGNAYVTGDTYSKNFPTQNAYDGILTGFENDAFVTKLSGDPSTPIVPIVLVHGWTSTSGIWGDLTNRLKADGFGPVWPVQLVPCGTEEERLFDPGNLATVKYLFRGNASELSSQIRQRFNSMPADSQARVQEIDIIAHSMGGLVSRRYIQSYFSDDDWRGERFRVRNLIMLGTPNKGSSFGGWWTASNLSGGCHWGDPAYEEIGEEYMKIFNAWFPDKVSETSYHAAAGSGGVGEAIITDCGAVYGCYNGAGVFLNDCDFGGNDGLVTVRSARTSPTGSYYPGVVRFLCHNQYYTDASLYTSFIKKVISGQPYSNDSEREGTEAPRIASICFQHSDSLVNAISTSGNFLIDANDVAYIYASANSVEFEFRITSPASQIYDSLSTTIDSSVIALTGEDGIRGFVIQNADVGQWQWELVLPSIPIAPVYFGILASTHSSVSATASQNLDYLVLGDSLVLNISVLDGAFPLTNLNIFSIPTYNNVDTLAPLQFTDDGLHSDGAANDGDYGLVVSNLQDGIISMRTTIEGNASGGPVKRILSQSAYIQSFSCGDADVNGIISISDAVFLINYIFSGGLAPNPIQAGDADCNSIVTISDAVYLINYIFGGGAAPCAACP